MFQTSQGVLNVYFQANDSFEFLSAIVKLGYFPVTSMTWDLELYIVVQTICRDPIENLC